MNQEVHPTSEPQNDHQYKFVEISCIPKKINAKTLTSLVVNTARIVPKKTELCFKTDGQIVDFSEQVALLEYKSEKEAMLVIERLALGPFAGTWRASLKKNPHQTIQQTETSNNDEWY